MNASSTTKKNNKIESPFFPLTEAIARDWHEKGHLNTTGYLLVYLEIRLQEGWTTREKPQEIYKKLGLKRAAFYRAIAQLTKDGLDLSVYGVEMGSPKNNIESLVRDRLQSQLGGLTEIKTPTGRIDLLTATEIIEVKQVSDWKSALGQILAYSAFYPEHQKRLHLFGNPQHQNQIPEIANSCLPFDVLVTFESINSTTSTELQDCENESLEVSFSKESGDTSALCQQKDSGLEKNSAPRSPKYDQFIRPPKPRPKFLYPEGDWLNADGCINEAFIRHRASLWQKSPRFAEMSVEDVMGLVCNHYMKADNHPNLQNDWTAYCQISARHVEAIAHRVEAGIAIKPAEQQEIVAKLPAALAIKGAIADSAYSSPVAAVAPVNYPNLPSVPVAALLEETTAPKGAINPDAYKPIKALAKDERIAQEIAQMDEQQCLENRLELSRMIRESLVGRGIAKRNNSSPTGERISHPTIDPEQADRELEERKQRILAEYRKSIPTPTEEDRILERIGERLRDPQTRDSAIAFANARGYDVSFEDDGTPTLEKLEF